MTDFDLDRLGDVWRQQPDPEEMKRLQRTAATVARRARITQVTDIVVALAVAAVVIFLVASNPRPATMLMGTAAILVLLFSNIRLRKVRQIELGHLTGSTEEMLDQSINRVEATLRYLRVSLILFPLTVLVGALVAYAAQGRPVLDGAQDWPFRNLLMPVGILVVIGVMVFCIRSIRRSRRELERLGAMRDAYRREQEPNGT
jgi:uncharacterized membrane protein